MMTSREYFNAVLNAHISDELDTASTEFIKRLDAKNAKRQSTDSKAKREVRERAAAVLAFLRRNVGTQFTRDSIADAVGMTAGQASAACKSLMTNGFAKGEQTKVEGTRKMVYWATESDGPQYLDREIAV